MMEVKQSTPTDFNSLTVPNNNGKSVEMDVMPELNSTKLKSDLLNTNDLASNGLLTGVSNGNSNGFTDAADDLDLDEFIDLNEAVNPELEDALLGEDADCGSHVVDKILAEVVPKVVEVIQNGTESSATTSEHNPGDDLDRLISKINDLEDCIETSLDKADTVVSNDVAADKLIQTVTYCGANGSKSPENEQIENTEKIRNKKESVEADNNIDAVNGTNEEHTADSTVRISDRAELETVAENVSAVDSVANVEHIEEKVTEDIDNAAEKEKAILYKSDTASKISPDSDSCSKTADSVSNTDQGHHFIKADQQHQKIRENYPEGEKQNVELIDKDIVNTADECGETGDFKESEHRTFTLNRKEEVASRINNGKVSPAATKADQSGEPEPEREYVKPSERSPNKTKSEEVDDSDDDIIFFVDKPEAKVQKEKNTEINQKTGPSFGSEASKQTVDSIKIEPTEKLPVTNFDEEDDDVVLLLDDDDEPMLKQKSVDSAAKTTETETLMPTDAADRLKAIDVKDGHKTSSLEKSDSLVDAVSKSELHSDNSDNACDKFETEKSTSDAKGDEAKSKSSDVADETTSNCSSSSNLLQETQNVGKTGSIGEEDGDGIEDVENEEDGDDVESGSAIELTEEESRTVTEEKECAPPAKRVRLSVEADDSLKTDQSEESRCSNKSGDSVNKAGVCKLIKIADDSNDADTEKIIDAQSYGATKRSHESLDTVSADEFRDESVIEMANKKPKTDEIAIGAPKKPEILEIKEIVVDEKTPIDSKDLKLEHTDEKLDPILVSPQLRVFASEVPIPLYPPPNFENTMSPVSLDFFSRFRKSFDKLTKTDLEELVLQKIVEAIMHKSEFAEMREIIDKQEKQITAHRAKIAEISKQFRDLEMVHTRVLKDIELKNSQFLMPVKITRAVGLQVYIPSKRSTEASANINTSGGHNLSTTSPQRTQMPPPSSPPRQPGSVVEARASSSALASAAAAAAINARRGCIQKVTPQRPVAPDSSMSSSIGSGAPGVSTPYRPNSGVLQTALTQGSQVAVTAATQQQTGVPRVLNKGVAAAQQRAGRFITSDQQRAQLQQQQYVRQQLQNAGLRKLVPKPASPSISTSQQNQFRRPETAVASSNTSVDHYMNQLNQASPAVGTVTITSAKPKEKAVIDLTDEDEVANAAVSAAVARARPATTTASSSAQLLANNRSVPPLTRMPAASQTAGRTSVGVRQQVAAPKTNSALMSNISTPPGTSITRVHISPANMPAGSARKQYNHPAPLPNTPPQPYNPAWKLSPPRPTIRISNLENGIVISWTMEDSMERYAECVTYQIYAYQETSGPPAVDSWRHVGDVKAMLLPMAVTLTQFQEGQRYYFAVRAVDEHKRLGPFSLPKTWS